MAANGGVDGEIDREGNEKDGYRESRRGGAIVPKVRKQIYYVFPASEDSGVSRRTGIYSIPAKINLNIQPTTSCPKPTYLDQGPYKT